MEFVISFSSTTLSFSVKKPPDVSFTYLLVHDQIRSDATDYIATPESASNRRWPMRLFKFKPQNRLTVIIRLWNSVRPDHGSPKLYALKQWKRNKSFCLLFPRRSCLPLDPTRNKGPHDVYANQDYGQCTERYAFKHTATAGNVDCTEKKHVRFKASLQTIQSSLGSVFSKCQSK